MHQEHNIANTKRTLATQMNKEMLGLSSISPSPKPHSSNHGHLKRSNLTLSYAHSSMTFPIWLSNKMLLVKHSIAWTQTLQASESYDLLQPWPVIKVPQPSRQQSCKRQRTRMLARSCTNSVQETRVTRTQAKPARISACLSRREKLAIIQICM